MHPPKKHIYKEENKDNTFKREIPERIHGDLLDKLPQLISHPVHLQIGGLDAAALGGGRVDETGQSGGGGGGGRDVSRDLISALEGLGRELLGFLGGLGGKLLRALGGLGDDVGEVGGGDALGELLRFLGGILGEAAGPLPEIHRAFGNQTKIGLTIIGWINSMSSRMTPILTESQ
ncbi:SecY protein transport family protein [Striga asiatica]|uniref:SecY protein transport family protein n=1 Tax=Striga asiatica TaxID=4170 RepID=A0A5A7Q9J6_STRAF|nr:SecY protein transport family protein [Striga asiatica]